MESPFYRYFYKKTDCIANAWNTKNIEAYLINEGSFLSERNGYFRHKTAFITIQLMLVESYDSWNNNEYDSNETNCINIVTSKESSTDIEHFLHNFTKFLGWPIVEELDE